MSVEQYRLQDYVFAAAGGGDSGVQFDFSKIPPVKGGEVLYARRLRIKVRTGVTAGAMPITAGNVLKAVQEFRLNIPNVGDVVKYTGLDNHRLFRHTHGHIACTEPAAVASGSTVTQEWQYIIDLNHPTDLKRGNGMIPIATLRRADFKVTMQTLANIDTNLSAWVNPKMQVWVEVVRLREKRIPTLYLQGYEQVAINQMPVFQPGHCTEAFLVPGNDAAWTAAPGDFQEMETAYGDIQLWPSKTSQRDLVYSWNSRVHDQQAQALGVGVLTPPMDVTGGVHDFIPVIAAPSMESGEGGHYLSYERQTSAAKIAMIFDAAPTAAPKLVFRKIADPGSWQDVIGDDLGIPAGNRKRPKLAKGKTGQVDVAVLAPVKDDGPR